MYKVKIVTGHTTYTVEVDDKERALGMAQAIMSSGVYRHLVSDTVVEFHKAYSVRVEV